MSDWPEPPENVRLVLADDTLVPVQTRFVGREDGLAIWEVIDAPPGVRVKALQIGLLPGHSAVRLPLQRP